MLSATAHTAAVGVVVLGLQLAGVLAFACTLAILLSWLLALYVRCR
jgi:hypothetical protein